MKTTLFFLAALCSFSIFAQTNVSGGIYQNTTWTLAGSPYMVTGSIVIFPNRTLTIEPGVQVICTADTTFNTGNFIYLEVRGTLIADGTSNIPVVFKSTNNTTGSYNWEGIRIKGSQGGSVQLNHFELHNSFYGIYNDIPQPGVSYTFDECYFRSNNYALQLNADLIYNNCTFESNGVGQAAQIQYGTLTATNCMFSNNFCSFTWSNNINVTNCTFVGNQNNIIGSQGNIQNCQFLNNTFGFAESSNINVNNCYFEGNGTGIEGNSSCEITNSTFFNNTIAMKIGDACIVSQNQINGNGIGIQVTAYNPNSTIIDNNSICNNSIHNLENLTDKNYQVNLNCFCSQDSTVIENGIYDGYDDITRGLVNYAIYNDSCQNILTYVTKVVLDNPASISELNQNWHAWFDGSQLVIENNLPSTYTVINALGLQVSEHHLGNGQARLSLDIPSGIYTIKGSNGKTVKVFIGN